LKKLIWLLPLIPIVSWGQKVGDSIMFFTIYNSEYNGTIEKIEPDGYFFKNEKKRVLYLKNTEIKSFQTYSINRSKLNALEKQIPSLNADISNSINNKKEEGLIEINKLSSITGENIIIFLKDGRELNGEILKITYKIDLFGDQYEVVKFLNANKKMDIITSEIDKVKFPQY
jgi:hypothetical protein